MKYQVSDEANMEDKCPKAAFGMVTFVGDDVVVHVEIMDAVFMLSMCCMDFEECSIRFTFLEPSAAGVLSCNGPLQGALWCNGASTLP